jgi:2-C-methyl-D-erythritol 4-phosphate cytidylyltransferase
MKFCVYTLICTGVVKMKCAAIIVAAGSGNRFGSKINKQFLKIDGIPMFLYSVNVFKSIKKFKQIIVVVPVKMIKIFKKYIGLFDYIAGGKERLNSIKNGLSIVKGDIDFVAIHDASRPLISKIDVLNVLKEAKKTGAAIAVEKIEDTVKFISNSGQVLKTLNRDFLRKAQTPQIFKFNILKQVYSVAKTLKKCITDDSQLIEKFLNLKISTVETRFLNLKITTKKDFLLAKMILKQKHSLFNKNFLEIIK